MKTFVRLREQLGAQDTKVLIEVKKNEKHKVGMIDDSGIFVALSRPNGRVCSTCHILA